jgi:MinD-like ATPase involved in chromosome partitioning or flagellar assembly
VTAVLLASIAGGPGVSTLAVGMAARWPGGDRPAVLVEADPDGGRLGTQLGVGVEPGLMSIALAARNGPLDPLDLVGAAAEVGGFLLLPAPTSAEQTHSALIHSAAALAAGIAADRARGWIVDAGRIAARSPALPLALRADDVLVVTGGDLAALQLVPSRADALRGAGCNRVAVVVAGSSPWPADEVAEFVGCDVVAFVPHVVGAGGLANLHHRRWRDWWRAVERLVAWSAHGVREGGDVDRGRSRQGIR